jgi:hypothetical protein
MLEVKRSPAKVCWHILCNGILIDTADTRSEANDKLEKFKGLM